VAFEEPTVHPLLELMPEVLWVRGGGSSDRSMPVLLETMAAELDAQRIGAATVDAARGHPHHATRAGLGRGPHR
jgi:hypothetical protein